MKLTEQNCWKLLIPFMKAVKLFKLGVVPPVDKFAAVAHANTLVFDSVPSVFPKGAFFSAISTIRHSCSCGRKEVGLMCLS